jgi:hypothetical protein
VAAGLRSSGGTHGSHKGVSLAGGGAAIVRKAMTAGSYSFDDVKRFLRSRGAQLD